MMTENVRKLVGVAAMAALVVVGVVATSGGDDVDFTRNAKIHSKQMALPEAEQARLAPAFLQQAAPKSLDTGPIGQINKEVGPITKGAKASIVSGTGAHALSTGKASVLEGKGVDGKGGTASIRAGGGVKVTGLGDISGKVLSGRKASIRLGTGVNGVADRIQKWNDCSAPDNLTVNSLKNVLVTSYSGEDTRVASYDCQDLGDGLLPDDDKVGTWTVEGNTFREHEAKLLAECMESKVGGVFLKSHTEAMAADCVATVMPALSPERAKRLGTYWQTPEQLTSLLPALASETNEE